MSQECYTIESESDDKCIKLLGQVKPEGGNNAKTE